MEILIKIENHKINLMLNCNGKKLDFLEILNEYNLSENLLPEIEKMIFRNKLKRSDIKKISIKSDQGENFTTTRLARSVANTWNCNFEK